MITSDPQGKVERLREVLGLLEAAARPEERDLLPAFARPVFAEMPDRIALRLTPEAVAGRIREHFRFVVREMPAPFQLYRGLPGIHVSIRNPGAEEAMATGAGQGIPKETTIVEIHTLDAPFIFESLKNYFHNAGLRVFAAIHPILTVRRQWERIIWLGGPQGDGSKELLCHFQIERVDSRERLQHMEHEVFSVLKTVFTAVEDFPPMVAVVRDLIGRLRSRHARAEDVASASSFLEWLLAENFIFIGAQLYRIGRGLEAVPDTALGVFTDPDLVPVVFPGLMEEQEAHLLPAPSDDRIVAIDYSINARAIHHLEPIDSIVVREWAADSRLAETTLLLGRFAKGALADKAEDIPLLREKQAWLLEASGALPNSHAFREIRAVYNRFPKRELFYSDRPDLKEFIDGIVYVASDDEIVVHVRTSAGYVALLVAFSRIRYSYLAEAGLKSALEEFGPISAATSADCGAMEVLIFYFDAARLEKPVEPGRVRELTAALVTSWEDRVAAAIEARFGEREGRRLFTRYIRSETRSGIYRESTPPEEVPGDIERLESLKRRIEALVLPRDPERATLKLFSPQPLGLTAMLGTLRNLGLSVSAELTVPLLLPQARRAFLCRYDIEDTPDRVAAFVWGQERLIEALRALDEERATNGPLNALILLAGLGWREVELLRTLKNHLLQIRPHYNPQTVTNVLVRNASVSSALVRDFAARLDPSAAGDREAAMLAAGEKVERALESVASLAEDEVLRALWNLARCAVRTNFYQKPERPAISIKIDSRRVDAMPSPRPMFEIYVHSRLLEGIHLRGGRVARGGIRWSDRRDDFRTEVLGLMKTQMVKNSIIVPVGSKGGFVLRGAVPSRPALDAYLIDRYREFVSGLLDVTDNLVDGAILHPPEVVRHDADDPYLVVAADKGTAHLSDTANSVSAQYGFWLGDAFASGGSVGYDHKKVGITARGAWECVKHHFRNLGVDVQRDPITVCGVGDMGGDVFGNGVLLSRTLKLVAAFNHAHIFVDPDPDPERSFAERQRLFDLPRSTWRDYDPSAMSSGGGVFDRSAKAIPLSPEMRRLLGTDAASASGEEVIRRILAAQVDLLYNGGIGTYVKATAESHTDVGDRANDRVRVDAAALRARVVAEGGNLGLTQRARLEYWAGGGACNTDAVDNSGGVDMSDHEVNIKILMDLLLKRQVVRSRDERNRVLAEMTDEVADLVLADNANQARALTLDSLRSAARYEDFVALVESLVTTGVLDRFDDAVPTRDELLASPARDRGLPRPLLAVVLGHAKMWAFDRILEGSFPESPAGRPFLEAYFPARIREGFREHLAEHPLRREIVATAAVNHVVNYAGVSFLPRVLAATRAGVGDAVGAYVAADHAAGAADARSAVLRSGLGTAREHELLLEVEAALEAGALAALEGRGMDVVGAVQAVRAAVAG
jgi:glutamate dehydrogenase